MERLQNYAWPGNIRELENVIERAVINAPDAILRVELPEAAMLVRNENKSLEEIEREHILRILEKTGWKIAGPGGAAEILGINPSPLRSRIQKLGIAKPWVAPDSLNVLGNKEERDSRQWEEFFLTHRSHSVDIHPIKKNKHLPGL